jgi:hypothetical protein
MSTCPTLRFPTDWFSKLSVNPLAPKEILPFRIYRADESELDEVALLRAATYGKHLPALGERLREPEFADYDPSCEVFIARAKLDGAILGTLRTHVNTSVPIPIEASIHLDDKYAKFSMVETTRLCVLSNPIGSTVRSMLFKALFQYCVEQNVTWMIATGRRPIDRIYDSLLFADVGTPSTFYPLAHVGNVLHRVMSFSTFDAYDLWTRSNHPLTDFIFHTRHPDIDLSEVRNLAESRPIPIREEGSFREVAGEVQFPFMQTNVDYRHSGLALV